MIDKSRRSGVLPVLVLAGALGAFLLPSPSAAQAPPPDETYLTLHTTNFRVTFPQDLDGVAGRAAERAERAWKTLADVGAFPPPAGPVELLLTDHVDLSNGLAAVAPYNRIVIWLSPPLDGMALSHFDDWLELVITHELVHIFHLDWAGTPGRIGRALFGRAPRRWPFFIGNMLPTLAVEGYAVQQESELTEGGRLHGTLQESTVRAHALDRGVESVGQGLGSSPLWPGGNRPYVYGALFFHFLAEEFGGEAVADFLKAAAGQWIPFRLDAAARTAFGESFSELWDRWRSQEAESAERMAREPAASGGSNSPEFMTRGARNAQHAAPHPSGDGRLVYVRADARSDVRLVLMEADGSERTLTRWNTTARPSWTPEGDLLATDLEFVDAHRLRNDLHRVGLDGRVTRLTRGLRVSFADSHPRDGRIVAVVEEAGTNRLVLLDREGDLLTTLREVQPGVLWSQPRWSPDGERVAVARWRAGGWSGILVLDGDGTTLAELGDDRSLHTSPTWSPDGRFVLWGTDRSGSLNIHARELLDPVGEADPESLRMGPLLQVTHLVSAGTFPSVDPAGRWLYLSVLTGEGWELARLPFRPELWSEAGGPAERFREGGQVMGMGHEARVEGRVTPYSALRTLRPRYWLPRHESPRRAAGVDVFPRAFGFETSATDVIGRHSFAFQATAPVPEPGRRFEAAGRYVWAGLGNPVLFVEGLQFWRDPIALTTRLEPGAPLDTLFYAERERAVGAGVEWRHQRMRRAVRFSLGSRIISRNRTLLELDLSESARYGLARASGELVEGRATLGVGTARSFPFSVSTQEGISASVSVRERRELSLPDSLQGIPGADGAFRDMVGVVAAYKGISGPGFADHVLALRLAGGTSWGPGAGPQHFGVGGGGGSGSGPLGFTYDAARGTFPIRGFPVGALRGETAWGATAEWRFPITLIHRGIGAWPLHLDRMAGALFWEGAGAHSEDGAGGMGWFVRSSAGAELTLSRSFLFEPPTVLRGGVAVPVQGAGDASIYLGLGWSF
jgi:hypothetical protein